MSDALKTFLIDIESQRGVRYRNGAYGKLGGNWENRDTLVRRYADHLSAHGRAVTIDSIREMLVAVDRGYSLNADQISRALASRYRQGRIAKQANGDPVLIDGQRYKSARSAADDLGISPQTVLNRIRSEREKWQGWKKAC